MVVIMVVGIVIGIVSIPFSNVLSTACDMASLYMAVFTRCIMGTLEVGGTAAC